MPATDVPFNRPHATGTEAWHIARAFERGHLSCDGSYSAKCREWLLERLGCHEALLVHSCTAALELSALLIDVGPGDEVIMPSYTFVSTANAFALRGAVPVFVDIEPTTLNIDPAAVEAAVTSRTKAIVPVHYAGVGCDMDPLLRTAQEHGLAVIEDAAQGVMSSYRGRALGAIGDLGTLSFHETKNVTCGEGGALIINRPELAERAEIMREKGTNRSRFLRGHVDKYTWVDLGSSAGLSDLAAAFLWSQFEAAESITSQRLAVWDAYHEGFADLEADGVVRRPVVPEHCEQNAHMYYLLTRTQEERGALLDALSAAGVNAVFHYVPLHSSPAGRTLGRPDGELRWTDDLSARLVRLPMWADLSAEQVDAVIDAVHTHYGRSRSPVIERADA